MRGKLAENVINYRSHSPLVKLTLSNYVKYFQVGRCQSTLTMTMLVSAPSLDSLDSIPILLIDEYPGYDGSDLNGIRQVSLHRYGR